MVCSCVHVEAIVNPLVSMTLDVSNGIYAVNKLVDCQDAALVAVPVMAVGDDCRWPY